MTRLLGADKQLKEIRDEVVACSRCLLGRFRKENDYFPVIGEGNHQADLIFVGEAPGLNEAKTAKPFCGASGKILDELLDSISCPREKVYICNILKDRPPNNRNPEKQEIEACTPFLERQIKIIKPKIIGALGNYAARFLLDRFRLQEKIAGISQIHGQIFETDYPINGLKIVPLYHPAVAVYNANMKETLKGDFKIIKKFLKDNGN